MLEIGSDGNETVDDTHTEQLNAAELTESDVERLAGLPHAGPRGKPGRYLVPVYVERDDVAVGEPSWVGYGQSRPRQWEPHVLFTFGVAPNASANAVRYQFESVKSRMIRLSRSDDTGRRRQ